MKGMLAGGVLGTLAGCLLVLSIRMPDWVAFLVGYASASIGVALGALFNPSKPYRRP